MHREQRDRAKAILNARGISRALFASFATVKWLTGFSPPILTGTSVFSGGPPLVWYEGGSYTLIVLDWHLPYVRELEKEPDCRVITYEGYSADHPIRAKENLRQALKQVMGKAGSGRLALELHETPADIVLSLREDASLELVSAEGWLDPLRMIKTAEELQKMRANFQLVEIGHAAARAAVKPGAREIEVWNAAHEAIQRAAGQPVPLGNDCVVGYRQENVGGLPSHFELRPGDSLIVDLSTILDGYWSDSCATCYCGEPSARQRAMHATTMRALELAISLVRPGAIANEIDLQVRELMRREGYPVYFHHTGHSLGVTSHEEPRIVPYNTIKLDAGMVIMLEPGIYYPGETSIRLEDAVLVTPQGAELLTHHDKRLP